jgi:hypothetical protein
MLAGPISFHLIDQQIGAVFSHKVTIAVACSTSLDNLYTGGIAHIAGRRIFGFQDIPSVRIATMTHFAAKSGLCVNIGCVPFHRGGLGLSTRIVAPNTTVPLWRL